MSAPPSPLRAIVWHRVQVFISRLEFLFLSEAVSRRATCQLKFSLARCLQPGAPIARPFLCRACPT